MNLDRMQKLFGMNCEKLGLSYRFAYLLSIFPYKQNMTDRAVLFTWLMVFVLLVVHWSCSLCGIEHVRRSLWNVCLVSELWNAMGRINFNYASWINNPKCFLMFWYLGDINSISQLSHLYTSRNSYLKLHNKKETTSLLTDHTCVSVNIVNVFIFFQSTRDIRTYKWTLRRT